MRISISLVEPDHTIHAVLANGFAETESGLHISQFTYLGVILFALTAVVNISVILLVQ
jgi:ABC-type phosphate transport system permease subunit